MAGIGTRGRLQTRHFADEEWADFAREEVGVEQRAQMQLHVDGCPQCARTLDFWGAISQLAGREASYQPPDGAVRQVREQFALHKPRSLLGRAAQAASLLFDSLREPLPVGVRAARGSSRQFLYRAGSRLVKLRLDGSPGGPLLSLVGQVLEEGNPYGDCPDLPVRVQSGRKTVIRTVTNRLGEFELELEPEPAKSLRLVVGFPGSEAFSVRLSLLDRKGAAPAAPGPPSPLRRSESGSASSLEAGDGGGDAGKGRNPKVATRSKARVVKDQ